MAPRAREICARAGLPAVLTAVVGATFATLGGCSVQASAPPADDALRASVDVAWSRQPSDAERLEQLVAACMAEAGFAYVPVVGTDASDGPAAVSPADATGVAADAAGVGPEARTGYGVTAQEPPAPRPADPNAAVVAALTPAEQDAYRLALDGAARPDDADGRYDWRRAGCRGSAQNAVYGDPATLDDAAALAADLAGARLTAASDPRVAELDEAWAACMRKAGHPGMASADDAEAAVRAAWDALWAQAWAALPADPSEDDVAAARAAAGPAVADLAEVETALAAADRACRTQIDYDAGRDTVEDEHRERFYEAHRAELDAWVADGVPAVQQ